MNDQEREFQPLPPPLQSVHDSMMQGLGQLADYFGYNRIMGELYATLLLHPGAVSLDELKERVHKSKASVSMNTRTLEYMGAVKEVWVREDNPSNRKFYEAEKDLWKIISKMLGGRELKDLDLAIGIIQENIAYLEESKAGLDSDHVKLADFYIQRMEVMISFFRFAKLMLTTLLQQADKVKLDDVTKIEFK